MTRLTLSFSGLHNHLGKPWPENLGPLEVCSLPDGKKGTRQRAIALGYGGRRASICFSVFPPTSPRQRTEVSDPVQAVPPAAF